MIVKLDFIEPLRDGAIDLEQLEAQVELAEEELADATDRLSELGEAAGPTGAITPGSKNPGSRGRTWLLAEESLDELKLGLDPLGSRAEAGPA